MSAFRSFNDAPASFYVSTETLVASLPAALTGYSMTDAAGQPTETVGVGNRLEVEVTADDGRSVTMMFYYAPRGWVDVRAYYRWQERRQRYAVLSREQVACARMFKLGNIARLGGNQNAA